MDEIHENETSALITNSETTKKLKIVTSLSNLITFVGSCGVLNSKNVVERLLTIIKMLMTEIGDKNNKEVDTKVTNILSAPTLVELLDNLDDDNADVSAYPLGIDDVPHHHHSIPSSLSDVSSEMTSDSDDAPLIGDDVADSGFLTTADLQCPECGQCVPGPRQNPGFPRHVYSLSWTEDADTGLLWCGDENEVSLMCHSPGPAPSQMPSQEADTTSVSLPVSKEACNDINERKCETGEKEECQSVPKTDSLSPLCSASADTRSDPFFTKVSNAISSVAPNFIFDKVKSLKRRNKRRAKQVAKVVPDEFRTLWRSLTEADNVIIETPAPYPKVDWSCVNSRFIKNIPSPSRFPIHSCSKDPDFYEPETPHGTITGWNSGANSQFTSQPNPFGCEYGYQTTEGIVSVPAVVHHGYVWQNHKWLLHAKLPTQPQHEERRERRRRGKRGGRRGERGKRG